MAICPPATLGYVVPSRATDVLHSPGGAFSLSSGMVQAGGTGKCLVHKSWQIQDVPGACTTCSEVLCFVFFAKRRKENKKKKGNIFPVVDQPLPFCSAQSLGAVMNYEELI
jgi:hypothetical protein